MQLIFEQIRAGGDRNFGYLLADREARTGVLIDPSFSPDVFVQRAVDQQITITHVINTHSHPDHTSGNAVAVQETRALLLVHKDSPTPDAAHVADGDTLAVGSLELQFVHVPGHCADHILIYEPHYGLLITGDLLFVGKVGGTSNDADARTEWESLQRLRRFPPETTVWPGHDYGVRPSSTLALEQASNPFLRVPDVEAFIALKRDWAEVKRKYGLK